MAKSPVVHYHWPGQLGIRDFAILKKSKELKCRSTNKKLKKINSLHPQVIGAITSSFTWGLLKCILLLGIAASSLCAPTCKLACVGNVFHLQHDIAIKIVHGRCDNDIERITNTLLKRDRVNARVQHGRTLVTICVTKIIKKKYIYILWSNVSHTCCVGMQYSGLAWHISAHRAFSFNSHSYVWQQFSTFPLSIHYACVVVVTHYEPFMNAPESCAKRSFCWAMITFEFRPNFQCISHPFKVIVVIQMLHTRTVSMVNFWNHRLVWLSYAYGIQSFCLEYPAPKIHHMNIRVRLNRIHTQYMYRLRNGSTVSILPYGVRMVNMNSVCTLSFVIVH